MDDRIDKIIIVALIALGIFILGVQIGIHHGRELQKQDFYDYYTAN
jgi:hypothetical protein